MSAGTRTAPWSTVTASWLLAASFRDSCRVVRSRSFRRFSPHPSPALCNAKPPDTPSERASNELHKRHFSVKMSPVTPTPHIMRTSKAAGQEPFAVGSRMATHSTWCVIGNKSPGSVLKKPQVKACLRFYPGAVDIPERQMSVTAGNAMTPTVGAQGRHTPSGQGRRALAVTAERRRRPARSPRTGSRGWRLRPCGRGPGQRCCRRSRAARPLPGRFGRLEREQRAEPLDHPAHGRR